MKIKEQRQMYSSTLQQTSSAHSCFFDEEDHDNGSKTTLDADTSDFNHEVYLCMVWHGGFLGLAFFDLGTLQIHFMIDIQENDNFSLVRQVVHQIHPSVIALNTIQDSRLLTFLRTIVSEIFVAQSGSSNDVCRLEFLPNVDFNYQVSRRRILALNIPSVPTHLSQDERSLYFSSLLPFGSSNMISSIGGLLKYLEKTRVGIELEANVTHVPVLGLKAFIPEHHIQMDGLTYCALKIFETEIHPSTYKAGHNRGGKEGLSLYGILNRCKSRIGSRMLREWFLRPLKCAAPIKQRHEAVAFFMSAHNMEVVKCLAGCLKHIRYIPRILLRMSKAQATVGDWGTLYKTLYHAVYIGDIAKSQPRNVEIFRKIASAFTEDLLRCVNLICKTIDFEESKIRKRFIVLPHVDKNLDEKKRTYNGLPDLMNEVARQEIETLSSDITECYVSYLPEIGYLLVIDLPEGKTPEDDHSIEGMKFMFHSNNQLFYKSPKTSELDDQLGDTQRDIIDIELNIMHRLQATILECTTVMLSIMELAAELDCLMALATCASEFNYVQPKLVQENVIHIKAGRHPLQELCCNIFVPNDVTLGVNSSKMKLITGPNACGKSVYLKQVALIVFMAHIGSFVPAEEANIGPCDAIFSRLKSLESTAVRMSTFMQDLSQVSQAVRSASSKSLVIVDEFGKGTESTDGLSLLTAVIKYWIEKESECPFALIATHFHSIIQQRLLPRLRHVEFLTFDTVANEEELVFLYQLIPGHTSSSYAGKCAAQVGIPSDVVKRGHQVSDLLCQFKTVPVEDSSTSLARRQIHENIVDKFLDLNLDGDDINKFLKDIVLKLCDDARNRDTDSRLVNDNSKKKENSIPVEKSRSNVFKPSTSKTNLLISGCNENNQTSVSNIDGQSIRGTRIASECNGSTNEEDNINPTKTLNLNRNSLDINKRKHGLPFETPTFPSCKPKGQSPSSFHQKKSYIDPKNKGGMKMPDSGKVNLNAVEDRGEFQTDQVQKTSNRQKSQNIPLFSVPSNPKFCHRNVYDKASLLSSPFVAGVKRKSENVWSITHIKHEKLSNFPTPCFSSRAKNPALSTKITSSSSAKDTNTTPDASKIEDRYKGTSTDLSNPDRSSDVSEPAVETTWSANLKSDFATTTDYDEFEVKYNFQETPHQGQTHSRCKTLESLAFSNTSSSSTYGLTKKMATTEMDNPEESNSTPNSAFSKKPHLPVSSNS